jgi:hypothetical protein
VTAERWAQQIIENELNCPVVVHDDGSQPSMYDLRMRAVEAPDVAIECVRAVDPVSTETWNVGPGKGPLHLGVKGDWMITIARDAHIRTIRQRIEPILRDLEERDVRRVSVGHLLKRQDSSLLQELASLGIRHAACLRMPGIGRVHWTMKGSGGVIDSAGSALPQWIEEFLCDPEREDVLFKLRHTGAQERWVFVPVAVGGTPWSVESYLTGELEYLPSTGPKLPSPVTGIWVTSTHGTHGVRWDRARWRLFRVNIGLQRTPSLASDSYRVRFES